MTQEEYKQITQQLTKEACFKAHSINREESSFMKTDSIDILNRAVWIINIVTLVALILVENVILGDTDEADQTNTNFIYSLCEVAFGCTILMIFCLTMYNCMRKPPNDIFITYESTLREIMEQKFDLLNNSPKHKGKLKWEIS